MTSEFVKNSKHSQEMIAKREARYKDPGATNMWDFLLQCCDHGLQNGNDTIYFAYGYCERD